MKKIVQKVAIRRSRTENDFRLKIRLGFNRRCTPPIITGADSNTTNKFDLGYDAMFDTNDNDMYWELEISLLFNRSNFNDDLFLWT
jgi:hypothetical protein